MSLPHSEEEENLKGLEGAVIKAVFVDRNSQGIKCIRIQVADGYEIDISPTEFGNCNQYIMVDKR